MSLREKPVLLLDCQTTGMRPPRGSLLEIAWTVMRADQGDEPQITSYLVALPEGEELPLRISEITGIEPRHLEKALPAAEIFQKLGAAIESLGPDPLVVIHYAQFEKPFLAALFQAHGVAELPFRILCTHQLAQRLLPQLPSQNIRGVAGHFGHRTGEIKRASAHVKATIEIWRGLARELEQRGFRELTALQAWMREEPKPKKVKYEYNIDRLKRLNLPEKPGIYRMLAKNGEVLYVGKATSLRDRVNSYFRGRKNRDRRKLEMLAQVWDLQVTECETPLEAALLETDEIKRLNPPYNVSLKTGRRRLIFYSRDFESLMDAQDEVHELGPFRPMNSIEQLRSLRDSLEAGEFQQIFYREVEAGILKAGFEMFAGAQEPTPDFSGLRGLLALGMRLLRERTKPENIDELAVEEDLLEAMEEDEEAEDLPPTPEEIAAKFERLFLRAAAELRRARALTRLLNSRVRWKTERGIHTLDFHEGHFRRAEDPRPAHVPRPWRGLGIAEYDRMSILLSEISRREHWIEK
ncbi:MAG: GIY-YIG nuclease family protein [Bdellovibrionaceae bacterium]|nr:GIY-YIG nuclease family protein [Pseudobdellovibrionaceae bacterium]